MKPLMDRIIVLRFAHEKGFPIIDKSSGDPISCDNCVGACCKDMRLDLSLPEKELLERGGTVFTEPLPEPDEPLPDEGYDVYKMEGACGWLRKNPDGNNFMCGTYETRPGVCRDFRMGEGECIAIRAMEGKEDGIGKKKQ